MFTAQGIVKPKRLEFDKKNRSEYYGKLSAGPFERGFGVTIGSSLRRMLLSSIEGAAVVAVKFEGIFHEFSSIPGVVEDVTEIVLNIKQLNLRLTGEADSKRIYIKASEAGTVYAKDIIADPDVEILNPDHALLTIDQSAKVDLEMIVRKGRGYVPADKHIIENESVQMIPIDSSFSPIEKISYHIENTRVGQSSDYDSLVMELWTNGGITPEDAVAHAAKIVKDHMQIFINFDEELFIKVDKNLHMVFNNFCCVRHRIFRCNSPVSPQFHNQRVVITRLSHPGVFYMIRNLFNRRETGINWNHLYRFIFDYMFIGWNIPATFSDNHFQIYFCTLVNC